MTQDIVILHISAEGGGLTIHGRQTPTGVWEFRSSVNDHTPTLITEDDAEPDPAIHEESRWFGSL
jgi:hypothetical protein